MMTGMTQVLYQNQKKQNFDSVKKPVPYTNFLNQYPESQLKDSVNFLIEKIYYKQCENSDSINSYINFLKRYPHNNFTNDVRKLLEKKGTIITLPKKKLISLSKISLTPKDHCWLEYNGLLNSGLENTQPKNRFTLWYKRDRVDSRATKVATINGEIEQILGGTWEYKYYHKGQQLGFTLYDEYGRPKKATRMPTETAVIKVKFVCITSNDAAAEILLLSESKIVTKIK